LRIPRQSLFQFKQCIEYKGTIVNEEIPGENKAVVAAVITAEKILLCRREIVRMQFFDDIQQ
jgi:hypothetical protein